MDHSEQLLDVIATSYDRAEFTCLVAAPKNTKDYFNLLTIIEFVPSEQLDSPPIGKGAHPNLIRDSSDEFSFYLFRLPAQPVIEMLTHYRNARSGIDIEYKGEKVHIRMPGTLIENPPEEHPLLIDTRNEKTMGRILPPRKTCSRVWSRLNIDKGWTRMYDKKFFEVLGNFSKTHLGADLNEIPEHLGNIYLFGCNPILRSWKSELLDYDRDLLFRFRERVGQTVVGSTIVLEEKRSDNTGFHLTIPIISENQRVALPYFPDALSTKIFDPAGRLLESTFGSWANISFSVGVQSQVVNYRLESLDGKKEEFKVPKRVGGKPIKVGNYDFTAAHFLSNALHQRRHQELAVSKEFVFFPKEPKSVDKAKAVVAELLNKAKARCMILDPYFGVEDLIYAFRIEDISLEVKIISSAAFLNDRPKPQELKMSKWKAFWKCIRKLLKGRPKEKTYLERLHDGIIQYREKFPAQKIACRVLVGRKSPLHDRFIVIDDDIYLLGSSLNEFGSRTTTIIKVPTPKQMIEQAESWWKDDNSCPLIESIIQAKDRQDDF